MKVPGYFKDELAGKEMTEFIALRSKMYAYRTEEKEAKILKGISMNVVKQYITFDDYKDTLFNNKYYEHKMWTLNSKEHEIFIEEITKSSLCPFNDKRRIMDNRIETLPFGCDNIINCNYV
jgi:hypothetical protein